METYELGNRKKAAAHALELDPWPRNYRSPRVNWTSYSPDGIYLAVARSDNRTQVFDTRFLGRGLLYDFEHDHSAEATQVDNLYGVYKGEWLEDPRAGLQLLTSGADGM